MGCSLVNNCSPAQKNTEILQKEMFFEIEDKILKVKEYVLPDGEIYSGEYQNLNDKFQQHGEGTQTWPDGATYSGSWFQGSFSGQGIFVHPNGDRFQGVF